MKKIYLLILSLGAGIIFLFSSTTAQELTSMQDKKIESLFDETIKDVGKLVGKAPGPAQEVKEPGVTVLPEEKKTQELIDLEFNQANLEDVLKVIAETGGMNIVLDPTVRGRKIDLHLKKISITDALEILYNAHSLSSYTIGNILFISTEDKIKKGTTKMQIVELKNITADETKALLGNLVSVINSSKEINTLVLVGAAQDLDKAMAILKKVDVPQLQVLLEAKIIEINNDYKRQLGIDWPDYIEGITFQETKKNYKLGSVTVPTDYTPLPIHRFAREALQFDLTLQMLEDTNKAKVLSSPRVNTINNKEAQIFIGDKVPYIITTVTGGVAATEVRFVEPGIRLKITPSIIDKDFVVIKIEPEVSYILEWIGTGGQYPHVRSREATAYVRVKNGQPFIMGGLLNKEDKKHLYQVPFLGKIPLLGNLFTYEKKEDYNTDLIITVIPTIISGEASEGT